MCVGGLFWLTELSVAGSYYTREQTCGKLRKKWSVRDVENEGECVTEATVGNHMTHMGEMTVACPSLLMSFTHHARHVHVSSILANDSGCVRTLILCDIRS